jgi:16S rRNA (guanine966-N2)-methyltransferase
VFAHVAGAVAAAVSPSEGRVGRPMRVIAGTYRSRILRSLKGLELRPSSDRLRETLFNVLTPQIAGARFLDLFAGTGAIGIEALSRGAAEVAFVEKHRPAVALIRKNLESLGINSEVRVIASDVLKAIQELAAACVEETSRFDFIFLDPPYAASEEYERVLEFVGSCDLLAADGVVIAEHQHKFELEESIGLLRRVRVLKQGNAVLSFYRRAPNSY